MQWSRWPRPPRGKKRASMHACMYIHAKFNSLQRTNHSMYDKVQRLLAIVKEHNLSIAPQNVACSYSSSRPSMYNCTRSFQYICTLLHACLLYYLINMAKYLFYGIICKYLLHVVFVSLLFSTEFFPLLVLKRSFQRYSRFRR